MAEGDSNFTNLVTSGDLTVGANASVVGTLGVSGASAFTSRVTTTDGVASGTAKVVGGRAYSLAAAGTAVTATNSETTSASFSIPANTIKAGTVIRVRYQGIATATNSTDTLTVKLKLGSTNLISTAAVDVANNDTFTGMFELVGRAAPAASAAVVGVGLYNDPAGTSIKPASLASTNFATNGALTLAVTLTWSSNNAGNSGRVDVLNVEVL